MGALIYRGLLNVRAPHPVRTTLGVAHIVPELWLFAAQLTFGHWYLTSLNLMDNDSTGERRGQVQEPVCRE